ncbi:protein of unknown function (DUF2520) [Marinitoga piezophila KA3]|uniref:DUF2520 domain-containing protein n=1 Tax=Marinitoga piezophila (strain DSM 14283 / JCM 11233 / KA3) TaxID=443254 RepID=H2J7Z8_MARPK|nr:MULTISPECIES: DUF2520 domain-containing protein [Marinitoga]AEX85489.1 protein of unknown function (DUF2520) [Marinitoga piezophila KA3]
MKIYIIGPGKVGKTLYNCLIKKYSDIILIGKNIDISNYRFDGIIIITTPDDIIEKIWNKLKNNNLENVLAIGHCSGVLDSSFIQSVPHFSMHPNFPFNSEKKCEEIQNIVWGIEGNEKGLEYAKKLVTDLKGKYIIIPQNKKIQYHLAAVILSNFSYALAKLSMDLYKDMNLNNIEHLIDLAIYSLNNIKKVGLKEALTGPVARNDIKTIQKEKKIFKSYFNDENIYDFFIDTLYRIKEEN